MNKTLAKLRVGEVKKNNNGSLMEVIEYNGTRDVVVKFLEHGNTLRIFWSQFENGSVKNPYDRVVYGIGYTGEGNYKPSIKGKHTSTYNVWRGMLERCYSIRIRPTYKDCSVAEEWHNFQNFAKWYDENYYEVDGQKMHIDKDILIKGNKLYSPDTCVIVPYDINLLFIKNDANRGEFPIGVSYSKLWGTYIAHCSHIKNGYIGTYKTPEEAFEAYKDYKEYSIKQFAEKYKNKIPLKLYEAMVNYIVEITD
jgi:hypothetical protein